VRGAGRFETLIQSLGGEPLLIRTAWRFVSGLGRSRPVENGFVWHHTLGVPYLPGSSIRACCVPTPNWLAGARRGSGPSLKACACVAPQLVFKQHPFATDACNDDVPMQILLLNEVA